MFLRPPLLATAQQGTTVGAFALATGQLIAAPGAGFRLRIIHAQVILDQVAEPAANAFMCFLDRASNVDRLWETRLQASVQPDSHMSWPSPGFQLADNEALRMNVTANVAGPRFLQWIVYYDVDQRT